MAKDQGDQAMYSLPEGVPDLDRYRHLCDFCRTPIRNIERTRNGDLVPYCDQWCESQANAWWTSILVTNVPRKDPQHGRQWLTEGGDGV